MSADDRERTQPATVSDPEESLRGIEGDRYPWDRKGDGNNASRPLGVSVTGGK